MLPLAPPTDNASMVRLSLLALDKYCGKILQQNRVPLLNKSNCMIIPRRHKPMNVFRINVGRIKRKRQQVT